MKMTTTRLKTNGVLNSFGRRLKKLRSETGNSQETMALVIGIDRTYYAAIENGKRNVSLRNIMKIAHGFKISLSSLFEGVN